ncbi:hypothetical protein MGWOODY_Clf506 [hydrothermal vent metagenome]|uniref:Uncharacterized protein n=1 Tax=hydrothermal vent metagenome TaxID=652676 RepID=A0A160V6F1_9ZZZZ
MGLKEVDDSTSAESAQYSCWAFSGNMPANQLWLAQME